MAEADRLTIEAGPFDGMALMRRAGGRSLPSLSHAIHRRRVHVLCGPGNNGGDGYVVARLLAESRARISRWRAEAPKAGRDAAWPPPNAASGATDIAQFKPQPGSLVVDALYGAGLSKPVGAYAAAMAKTAPARRWSPSICRPAFPGTAAPCSGPRSSAEVTVTFFRKKPGHLFSLAGRIAAKPSSRTSASWPDVLDEIRPSGFENTPALWHEAFRDRQSRRTNMRADMSAFFPAARPRQGRRGLSAWPPRAPGQGRSTVLSPANALQVNAAHLTSIILRKTDALEHAEAFLRERKPSALVFGPGMGLEPAVGDLAIGLIAASCGLVGHIVFDADALTVFSRRRDDFLETARLPGAPSLVLTPHEGEFRRLFADIAADKNLSKVEKARRAARQANATIIYKGPDTVVASPDGRAAINANGSPWLATAGSGDVLAGICAGLLAQGMPGFEAACAAVWLHAEAGSRFGAGLIAEDLPLALLPVLRELSGPDAAGE